MRLLILLCLLTLNLVAFDCDRREVTLDLGDPHMQAVLEEVKGRLGIAFQEMGAPGMSVAIVHNQDVLLARGFGLAQEGKEASANTAYRIGGVTMPFVATMLVQLREKNKVLLKDPITKFLSSYSVKECSSDSAPPTLEMLASHLGGLPQAPQIDVWTDAGQVTQIDILKSLVDTEAVLPVGLRVHYSHLGYVVLGAALSLAVDEPFQQYIKANIFDPLSMSDTSFSLLPGQDLAQGHHQGKAISAPPAPGMAAAAGMVSTVSDIAKFLSLQFAKNSPVLSREYLDTMHQPQYILPHWKRAVGIGWMQYPLNGWTTVGHRGVVPGFSAEVLMIPELQLGVVVLTNEDRGVDWLAAGEEELDKGSTAAQVLQTLAPVVQGLMTLTLPSAPVTDSQQYLGVYKPILEQVIFEPLTVEMGERQLLLKSGDTILPLTHIEGDAFLVGETERLTFVRSETGQITGLVLASGQIRFKRESASREGLSTLNRHPSSSS